MKAIAVVIPRIFATAVTDARVRLAPSFQAAVDVIFICVHTCARGNRGVDQRLDGPLLHVVQHVNDYVTTALDHAENRGLLRGEGAASAFPLEASPPAAPPLFTTASGFPL